MRKIILASTLMISQLVAANALAGPVVSTVNGSVAGVSDGAVFAFKGLPFAAPPVGDLRWRAPEPAKSWQGVRDGSHFAASCEQPQRTSGEVIPWTSEYLAVPPFSEDCLYLNVWTPSPRPSDKLPVFVWIYGGGFTEGSGAVPIYRGAHLAKQGVVVVTFNYRLGALGFLAHPSLDAEQGSSGEYGLMDQVAALQWVKANIKAFGGDPTKVTIAGQSAGAMSVHDLLAAPSAAGLFARAIAESNSWSEAQLIPRTKAEAAGQTLATLAGAHSLADLRALPADRIVALQSNQRLGANTHFRPVDDGVFIPAGTVERDNVPVLLGSNQDEASAFSPLWQITTKPDYQALLDSRFQQLGARFGTLYPADTDADVSHSVRHLLADSSTAGVLAWLEMRAHSAAPAYGYSYDHPEPGPLSARFATFHSSEVPYVFGTLEAGDRPFTAQDKEISHVVQAYWVSFIKNGQPGGAKLMPWPQLNTGEFMLLGDKHAVTPLLSKEQRAAFRDWLASGGTIALF